jgi:hypothetical protein
MNKVCGGEITTNTWTKENDAIIIDPVRDIVIFDNERQRLLHFLFKRGIEHLVYAGTATNMCVLFTRNTSLKNMLYAPAALASHPGGQQGVVYGNFKLQCYLARDLTDAALPDQLLSQNYRPLTDYPDCDNLTKGAKAMVYWIENHLHVPTVGSAGLAVP